MLTNISKCSRTKQRIHYCMKQHICVRMTKKSFFIRNLYTA